VILTPASLALAADVTCYIDSVAGDDAKTGLSEADARASWWNIPTTCTVVKYKRGSVFNMAAGDMVYPAKVAAGGVTVPAANKINTLTNYGDSALPQPKFIKQRQFGSGGMISAYQGNLIIDGLYFSGVENSVQMKTISQGIVIMAGNNTKILNNEITESDIGMMISGTGCLIQGNYVHNLHVVIAAPPGVDPNLVGGAEGIFVNASNNEVAYNSFIDCGDYAEWTGGDCDGGASEVSVPGGVGGTVDGLKIHHNFGYNTCGFFEVSLQQRQHRQRLDLASSGQQYGSEEHQVGKQHHRSAQGVGQRGHHGGGVHRLLVRNVRRIAVTEYGVLEQQPLGIRRG